MYNTDFREQCENFRRHLFGYEGVVDPQLAAHKASLRGYVPQEDMEMIECEQNSNGEWVPKRE